MEQILKIILFSLLCYTFFKIKKNDNNKLKNDKGDELFSLLNNNKKRSKIRHLQLLVLFTILSKIKM